MVTRLISANSSEILAMDAAQLMQSIKASEGRVVLSENIVVHQPSLPDLTNAEIAHAFGADLILLNLVDVFSPQIHGIKDQMNFVDELHKLVGCPIGVNLEPVDFEASMLEERTHISQGRTANVQTLQRLEELGADFVCFTGNPGTGVTNSAIIDATKIAKEHFSGLIIAGKMHGAAVDEPVVNAQTVQALVDVGADVILVPAVGTVPGFTDVELRDAVLAAHRAGALVMSAIGTSQESSQPEVIVDIAIRNKVCGVDIQHIGDSGYGGLAPVENIFALSKAIRGQRHTVSRMARSINR
ncbi:haloacid dehalogenase-like hydrolase [Arcanobacterium bovis]|uniref:Haloacid dehalogenase-like hydrolase n=1 Tax=Arcanobacterium bovis TaxID=2529275 RepID=A0A4V6MYT2_9ACTO|nr:haloacid dehalogenase-like hydrolase [Arcanobacterium bovis]TBW22112.1 haloacid dehalogenase-like hydrolase [Arcanobacterium bovis]